MSRVELRHGAITDIGLVRQINEDAYMAAPGVFVVADGMGGHSSGDVASRIVSEEFAALAERGYDPALARARDEIGATLLRAQSRLLTFADAQRHTSPKWHTGTTVVACVLVESEAGPAWLIANVGDSRAYRLSGGELAQITVDHSVVQELIDAGAISPGEAAVHPERHVVTRALGSRAGVIPDFFLVPVAIGDRIILCSDGVSGMIDDTALAEVLRDVAGAHDAARALVVAALAAGGRDNATAIVVDVVGWAASHFRGPRSEPASEDVNGEHGE